MRRVVTALLVFVFAPVSFAAIKTETVQYKAGDTNLIGYLAYDDATSDRRPGVVVVHEWWGLNEYPKLRAEQLAKLGYVAFCADMFGEGKTTQDPKQAGEWAGAVAKEPATAKARFDAALAQLRKNSRVDGERIGAIGYCFGGGTVLNMARIGADLKGVVSFHGSLAAQKPAGKGAVKAQILVCHGAADSFEPAEAILQFQKEMAEAGAKWQMNVYSGAVHAFTNPEADKYKIPGVAYDERADKRSWQAMADFFEEVFRSPAKDDGH